MNSYRRAALLALPIAGLLLAGCGEHGREAQTMTTETREVGSFDSIEMEGAARLVISVGAQESLTVEASEDMLRRIRTEVRGSTLHITSKPRDWLIGGGRQRVTITVTAPTLQSLRIEGGNDVQLTGLHGGRLQMFAGGASNIEASGSVDELSVRMTGAGRADLRKLIAQKATVTVDGVGSVQVHSREMLDATMNGVGSILYSGSPRHVNTRMNGLGTITRDEKGVEERPAQGGETVANPWKEQREYERQERPAGRPAVVI